MNRIKLIFLVSLILILTVLISILLCVGVTILIVSAVSQREINNKQVSLSSNQTLKVEVKAESCPSEYSTNDHLLELTISNTNIPGFDVHINVNSSQTHFNKTCITHPGDHCIVVLDESSLFIVTLQPISPRTYTEQNIGLTQSCSINTSTFTISGAVILCLGCVFGVCLLLFVVVVLVDWGCFHDSSNALYG